MISVLFTSALISAETPLLEAMVTHLVIGQPLAVAVGVWSAAWALAGRLLVALPLPATPADPLLFGIDKGFDGQDVTP